MKPTGVAILILSLGYPISARGAAISRLTFEPSSGKQLVGSSSKTYELGIDDAVEIRVDEQGLLRDIGLSTASASLGSSLLPRIQFLRQAVDAFVGAQESLLAVKSAGLILESAKGTAGEVAARSAFLAANSSFSEVAVSAISPLIEALDSDIELKASLEPALNEAVLGDYSQMAEVLRRYLVEIDEKLGQKADGAQRVEIALEATIANGLRRQRVHLDGYDDIRTGEPVPFPRFQLALDSRAKEEFAASDKLAENVNRILDGSFERELKASVRNIEIALRDLAKTTKADILEAELNDTLRSLISARDENLGPIISEVVAVRDLFSGFEKIPTLEDSTKLDALLVVASAISAKATKLQTLANVGPERLGKLTVTLQRLSIEKPGLVSKKFQQAALDTKEKIAKELAPLQTACDNLREIAKAIGLTAEIGVVADNLASRARELGVGASLDSRFDLQTVKDWERHPGDQVSVSIRVTPKGADAAKTAGLAFGRQQFRLEAFGLYLQARGALLFVDSRTGAVPKQSFEAAPGAAFHFRYGWENKNWWNEWLAPGAGMSLTMLNFDNNKNFELGVAGSVTFLRDLFWVGYGRNLQAQANFFFVGINPIALGSLYQQKAH